MTPPVRLGMADIAAALALSGEAGWNQTAADWAVFLRHGQVFGLHAGGRLAATAASLPYDRFGFVAMVLTTASWRGRGFATALLAEAVAALMQAGRVPLLDATDLGRPVYARQGFCPVDALERWQGEAAGTPANLAEPDTAALAAHDAAAFGARRDFLLADFLARPGSLALADAHGAVIARAGRHATQIGPLLATGEDHATLLLQRALDRLRGPVFLDVPTRWSGLAGWLAGEGFRRQRGFTRMALGRDHPIGDPARLFAAAGPEFG